MHLPHVSFCCFEGTSFNRSPEVSKGQHYNLNELKANGIAWTCTLFQDPSYTEEGGQNYTERPRRWLVEVRVSLCL